MCWKVCKKRIEVFRFSLNSVDLEIISILKKTPTKTKADKIRVRAWLTKVQFCGVAGGVPATVSRIPEFKEASELGDHVNHCRNPALFQLDS